MPKAGIKCLSSSETHSRDNGLNMPVREHAMDSMKYYVSVMGRSVIPDPSVTSYEWIIQATPQEAEQLLGLLSLMQEKEEEPPGMVFPWPDTPEIQ